MEDIPEDLHYKLRLQDGVVHVYENADDLQQCQPRCLPYPDLQTFVLDMSQVLSMIADGPM